MSSTVQATSSTSSTSNIQLITDALLDYANITGIELSKDPFAAVIEQANSPGAILELLQERKKAFKDYREGNRLFNCLGPSVNVIQAFSGILGEAFSLVPFPPAKAIFVGIDALLSAASGVTSSYDALLDLFESLANFLKRLEVYTTIPHTPMMTDLIVKIMVELLSVLALATKQIKQGRFKKFMKMLSTKRKDKIQAALERLDRLTKDEGLSAVAQTLGVVHSASNEIYKTKLERWLSSPDPSTNQNFVSRARHRGTAAWFFESSAFKDWKAKGSLLWIYGKPGAGKSTLLSAIIQDVMDTHAAGLAVMAYHYFDFRDVKKQDCYGLLSSLISQLSAESDFCYNILSQLYSVYINGKREPDVDSLKECMKDMLNLPGQGPIYIIVDALDECPNFPGRPSAREEVLQLIEELVGLNLPNLHLCVTSRPEMDIRSVLEPLTTLKICLHDEIGQKKDIIKYIQSVVQSDRSMRRWKEEDKQLVVDTLSHKADGMFRWVACQVDRLCRTFPASIRSVLEDLPKTLDETYGRTLLGIDEEKREYAQRLFRCLAVSIRPLRVEELAEVVAIRFPKAAPPTFNAAWRPENAEEAVLSACSSLISIVDREGHRVVQFSHFSVKEYLTSERLMAAEERLSYYHILPERAHTILAHAGLSVLLQLDDKIDLNTIAHFPLAPYAARYWVDHAKFGDVSLQILEVMERLFNPTMPHFAAWVWLYDIDHHWIQSMSTIHPTQPEATPFYYASLCGFRTLMEHLIAAHSPDVNGRGGSHTTALHAASVEGHLQVASLLLKNGADPNSRDHLGRVPLHNVSMSRQLVMAESSLEIAQLLVHSGADVNVADDEGHAPLHMAACEGYREIAELLLGSGASLDARNEEQQTPLRLSCSNGKLDMAQFLIDRGSDINSREKNGFIPLHAASRFGFLDVARLLLNCGSDVNARTARSSTPLHLSSRYRCLDLARLLIDRGADVNAQDGDRLTPLHLASQYGCLDLARLLIDRGADVNAQDGDRWTPLHLASRYGCLVLARLLIDRGADVNAQDEDRWTPLRLASQYGCLDLARLLIDRGADVNAQDGNHWTPLRLALQYGCLDLARLLIDRGADVNAQDGNHWTPLRLASRYGYLDIARLLIDRGADVNAQKENHSTALHLACNNGHIDIAKLLIDRGANVDSWNDNQETPLAFASSFGHLDIARFLIENGAAVSAPDKEGDTPFHMAADEGHLQVTKFLLECGIDVDIRNGYGETPLYCASWNGKLDVVHFLIDQGANIHIGDNNNTNSLHVASLNGCLDVVQLMINSGIPVDVRDGSHMTPLAFASKGGKVEVGRFLIDRGADLDVRDVESQAPLHLASQHGHLDMARLLLDRGIDPNIKRNDLSSPLHLASANGHLKVAELLVQRGASVDVSNDNQQSPLYQAVTSGNAAITRLLIDHGATVHTADSNGWTVLHAASRRGHLGVVKLLLRRGADVDMLSKTGRSAAELASENGQAEVVKFISEYKANPNTRNESLADEDGKDEAKVSLHVAAEEGNFDTVMLLLERGVDFNARDASNRGRTPLSSAADNGNIDVVQLLIHWGAEVDSCDVKGWTPLHFSSRDGSVEVSRVLLNHGANVNASEQDFWTPMHLSAYNGYLEMVKLLLEHGADIHAMNRGGETPYQVSLRSEFREIADLLRNHGTGRVGERFDEILL